MGEGLPFGSALNCRTLVRAESERAFVLGFVSMWGNIQALISGISVVVVLAVYFPLVLVGEALSKNGVFGAPAWPYASSIITAALGLGLLRRQLKV